MPCATVEAQREYQRRWIADRRSSFFAGKTCVQCGSSENLELDHIDPASKTEHRIWSWSEERRLAEIAKCQVLCAGCHLLKSIESDWPKTDHGRGRMYKLGCRCTLCVEFKRVENSKRRR
jgi:5-methylcytosine-specific restriction endonuclease McrA